MTTNVPLRLSSTSPDFESVLIQLQLFLNTRTTWTDILTSSTGETLMEMMAATAAFNQFSIESAARETYLGTAIRDSSIYAITRMLGVRISRKAPASMDCFLTRTNVSAFQTIPKYTQFLVNNKLFFNRHPIMFIAGSATTDTFQLYEGTVKTQSFVSDAVAFKEIYLNEPGFVVSDIDVDVSIVDLSTGNSESWSSTDQGIWNADGTDKVYYDSTSGLGDVILQFGDGYHGYMPPVGSSILVTYVVTTGSVGNNGGSNLDIVMQADDSVTGKTLTSITGGADEKPSSYYKILAPFLFRARSRAVTSADYKAIVSSYPGIASVTVQSQRDVAPNDLRWMNVVRICVLPELTDTFSDSQWDDFELWFKTYYHAAIKIQRYNPTKIVVDVQVTIALKADATPDDAVPTVQTNIRSLFAKGFYTLGKRIAVSDILEACDLDSIDYTDMVQPLSDYIAPDSLSYFELGTLTVNVRYSERQYT